MGYELPDAMGVRLGAGDDGSRIVTFIGEGHVPDGRRPNW